MPDELTERLNRLGPTRSRDALRELLAYYRIQKENRDEREWNSAMIRRTTRSARR